MEKKKEYCDKCGRKLETAQCGYYDEYTGKVVTKEVCTNARCVRSCEFFGHDWKYRLFRTEICLKCGEETYHSYEY